MAELLEAYHYYDKVQMLYTARGYFTGLARCRTQAAPSTRTRFRTSSDAWVTSLSTTPD